MENNNFANYVAIISAAIAVLSAIFSFVQARSAKNSYRLQKKIYSDGEPKFSIQDISDSLLYNQKNLDEVYYFFKIILPNLSDKATSIIESKLELKHKKGKLIVKYNEDCEIRNQLERLTIPIDIPPHSSRIGWLVFSVSREIYDQLEIDTHYLFLKDLHGVEVKKEKIYVMEEYINHENK